MVSDECCIRLTTENSCSTSGCEDTVPEKGSKPTGIAIVACGELWTTRPTAGTPTFLAVAGVETVEDVWVCWPCFWFDAAKA
jgi:hypothetical protein